MTIARSSLDPREALVRPDEINNPAWEYVQNVPHDPLFARHRDTFTPTNSEPTDNWKGAIPHRRRVTSTWTWAIPDPNILAAIVRELNGRPVVEVGAGNGYWAWMLTQLGVDVLAYDRYPPGHEHSWFGGSKGYNEPDWPHPSETLYHPVEEADVDVLDRVSSNRVLFLCWPPYTTDMAYKAVKHYKGDTILYIGEGDGGCNADDKFWALMEGTEPWNLEGGPVPKMPEQEWEPVRSYPVVQWAGIHDNLTIYRKTA